MLKEEVEGLKRSQTEREKKLSTLLREHAHVSGELDMCRRRLDRVRKLEHVNVAQFESLMSTNLQVGDAVPGDAY